MLRRSGFAIGLLLAAGQAWGQDVPETVSFTARLQDDGQPLAGAHDFRFALFDVATGGAEVWSETRDGVIVTDGLVYLDLGAVDPLDVTVFAGGERWLAITVDGTAMQPRLPIASVPYAIRAASAASADTVGGFSPDDFIYTAGSGLTLAGNQFALDTAAANTWTGAQTFMGEIRSTDASGMNRIWGEGRPGTTINGTTGAGGGLCTNGAIHFGLSASLVTWEGAAAACPQGTWVCSGADRGSAACDTALGAGTCDAIIVGATCWDDPADLQWGWTTDTEPSGDPPFVRLQNENGMSTFDFNGGLRIRVWCCTN
jgi:hypothetical protein